MSAPLEIGGGRNYRNSLPERSGKIKAGADLRPRAQKGYNGRRLPEAADIYRQKE
jgi:hypothetical protein